MPKLDVYARQGVTHAWMVDALASTLKILWLDGDRWTIVASHWGAEVVRAEPFAAGAIDLSGLDTGPAVSRLADFQGI